MEGQLGEEEVLRIKNNLECNAYIIILILKRSKPLP